MFAGHALLAFALAVLLADWRGWPARRALALGVVTGAFAALPDVDVAYALVAIDPAALSGAALTSPETFWNATHGAHRSVTHSLVVALLAGPAFGLWAVGGSSLRARASRIGAAVALVALVAVAALTSGAIGGIVAGAFVVAGLGAATLCRLRTDFSARLVALAATAGLLSHPWGDLVTGGPPELFYPLAATPFEGRIVLHSDPTVHLLGAFAIELGAIWLAAFALSKAIDTPLSGLTDRHAVGGLAYGVAAVAITPPTLDVSYHFVFSILSVGLLGGVLVGRPTTSVRSALDRSVTNALQSLARSLATVRHSVDRSAALHPLDALRFAVTGLAATTTAFLGYALVYGVTVAG